MRRRAQGPHRLQSLPSLGWALRSCGWPPSTTGHWPLGFSPSYWLLLASFTQVSPGLGKSFPLRASCYSSPSQPQDPAHPHAGGLANEEWDPIIPPWSRPGAYPARLTVMRTRVHRGGGALALARGFSSCGVWGLGGCTWLRWVCRTQAAPGSAVPSGPAPRPRAAESGDKISMWARAQL